MGKRDYVSDCSHKSVAKSRDRKRHRSAAGVVSKSPKAIVTESLVAIKPRPAIAIRHKPKSQPFRNKGAFLKGPFFDLSIFFNCKREKGKKKHTRK